MSNTFIDEIKEEGLIQETETLAESSPEEQTEETVETSETPAAEEENVPFHKHPRFKALVGENKHLKETVEQLASLKDEVERLKQASVPKETNVQIPAFFANVWGDNPEAWAMYQQFSAQEKAQYKEEIKKEILAEQNREKEEAEKWDKWINGQIESLEEEGKEFDRNGLLKVMSDYRPTDGNGNYDFKKGYELYSKLKSLESSDSKTTSKARKEIAGMTTSDNKSETVKSDIMTPDKARRTSWTGLL